MDFITNDIGWVAMGAQLLSTGDGGLNWAPLSVLPAAPDRLSFTSTSVGWASTDAGLVRTRDGGRTWTSVSTGSTGGAISRVDFIDEQHGWLTDRARGLIATDDRGATWTTRMSACGYNDYTHGPRPGMYSFIDADNGWAVCTGVASGIASVAELYRTVDGGRSWRLIADAGGPQYQYKIPHPSNGLSQFAGGDVQFIDAKRGFIVTSFQGQGTVAATADGGITWRSMGGSPVWPSYQIASLQFVSPAQGFAIARSLSDRTALIAISNGGTTWRQVYPDLWPQAMPVFADPQDGLAVGSLVDPGALLKTADGGLTWRAIAMQGNVSHIAFPSPTSAWAVTQVCTAASVCTPHLWHSDDRGSTWKDASFPALPHDDISIAATSSCTAMFTDGYLGAGAKSYYYQTDDCGKTFHEVGTGALTPAAIDRAAGKARWSVGPNSDLRVSRDGGATWKRIANPCGGPLVFELSQPDDSVVWAIAACADTRSYSVIRSTDDGATWTEVRFPEAYSVHLQDVTAIDSTYAWIGNGGALYATSDGGTTWTQLQ